MVNEHPERALALSYAPADRRPALAAVLALDDRLRAITAQAREPLIGQMRLTWWHQALCDLDRAPAPPEPLLCALAAEAVPHGLSGALLAEQVEGWEAALDLVPDDADALRAASQARGISLFRNAARVLGEGDDPPPGWGAAWGRATPVIGRVVGGDVVAALDRALAGRVAPGLRPLGAMLLSARADAVGRRPAGHPARVARLAFHRLTGR